MSRFYKMDPSDWDMGTAELSLEEEAAYLRIVNSINKHDAPVPNIDRVLAGMFRCSTRKARSLRDALIEARKIYIEDDRIWNDRARFEVNSRSVRSEKCAESGAKGGRKSGEQRAKALENNDLMQSPALSRIEKNRKEKNPPTPQGGDACVEDEFEEWWKHYPRKVSKGAARRAYKVARKKIDPKSLFDAVRRFALAVQGKEANFVCHASTWLNGERWDDQQGIDRPTQTATDEELLGTRVDQAKAWLSRNDTIATWMDRRDVADELIGQGFDYEELRTRGYSLPPRGNVIDLKAGGM